MDGYVLWTGSHHDSVVVQGEFGWGCHDISLLV